MNKIQQFWANKVSEAEQVAASLKEKTGFEYRVRHLFNGVNVEAWSVIASKWMLVKVIR